MNLLIRYIWAAIVAVTITVAAALAVTFLSSDVYRAQMTLAVGTSGDVISPELGSETQAVVNTVSQLVRSNVVAEKVIGRLRLNQTPTKFLQKLDVQQKPDAAALNISYDAPSRQAATAALSELVTVYNEQVKLVGADVTKPTRDPNTGQLTQSLKVRARVFDPPYASPDPVSPRPVRNIALAVALGLIIGGFWVALRNALDVRKREGQA